MNSETARSAPALYVGIVYKESARTVTFVSVNEDREQAERDGEERSGGRTLHVIEVDPLAEDIGRVAEDMSKWLSSIDVPSYEHPAMIVAIMEMTVKVLTGEK